MGMKGKLGYLQTPDDRPVWSAENLGIAMSGVGGWFTRRDIASKTGLAHAGYLQRRLIEGVSSGHLVKRPGFSRKGARCWLYAGCAWYDQVWLPGVDKE